MIKARVCARRHVEVDLLGPVLRAERGPDPLLLAGALDRDGREGRVGLAQEDPRDVARPADRPSGQTLSSVMNRSANARLPAEPQEVLELRRPARDVIDHHVEEDVVARGDALDVGPGAERRIDLARRSSARSRGHPTTGTAAGCGRLRTGHAAGHRAALPGPRDRRPASRHRSSAGARFALGPFQRCRHGESVSGDTIEGRRHRVALEHRRGAGHRPFSLSANPGAGPR